jgi:hypothetical protein
MAQYGLVKLTKHGRTVIPQATSERVTVDFSWVADITPLDLAISANIVSRFHWGNPLVLPFRGDGLI